VFKPARFLWWSHKATVGGLLLAFLIAASVVVAMASFGPTRAATGRIESFGLSEGKTGSHSVAVVNVDGRVAEVPVPPSAICRVGNEISLVHQRSLLGPSYTVALRPDLCR
jgi:hypothetical protein